MRKSASAAIVSVFAAAILASSPVFAGNAVNNPPSSGGGGTVSSASLPLVITAGNMTINAATTSTAGSLSAADKTKLDSLASGGQWDTLSLFVKATYPSLTAMRCGFAGESLSPGSANNVPYNTTTTASSIEGGGVKANNATFLTYLGGPWFQTPKTGPWLFAFRWKSTGGGAVGHDSQLGLVNAGGTHLWTAGRINGTSSTKWALKLQGTATTSTAGTANADGNIHTLVVGFDGTTVSMWIDPTIGATADVATTTGISNMADEAMYPFVYSAVVLEADVQWLCHAYVAP